MKCIIFVTLMFLMVSCSSEPEEITWGEVNKSFVALEKERADTFELLKEKPNNIQ